MKKAIRRLLMVLLLAAAAFGGYRIYEAKFVETAAASTTAYTQVVEVTKGSLAATVSVVGQLDAQQAASLAFKTISDNASLLTLAVQAGAVVTQGQVLATIDATPYQQAVDQVASDLQAAKETLDDLQTPATALELAQADVAVAQAKVALQKAQAALDDLTAPDISSLESAVASAKSALAKAQANLLAEQQDAAAKTTLDQLTYAESVPTAEYNRLAAETYSDDFYQDRLELAYNKMLDAQDTRVSYELNRQASALQAQVSLRAAQTDLADAQGALADAQSGGDPLKLAQAQLDVNNAQVSLQAAQQARAELSEGTDATVLAVAQAAVAAKQLALDKAQAALTGTQLVAPFAGTVLETYVSAGDQVTANTAILDLADMDTLQVVASIDETTIRQISVGQAATMTFDAFPEQSFTGQVLSVPLQGALEGNVMVYSVPISLEGAADLALRVGMTANVAIQVGQSSGTLLVPTLALTQSNGTYHVLVPNTTDASGSPTAVAVEVGLSDGAYTEILKGLSEGDRVLVQLSTSTPGASQTAGGPGGGMDMGGGLPPAQ